MIDPEQQTIGLRVQRLHPDAILPERAHSDDAGLDLASIEHAELPPGARATIGTGIAIELSSGFVGLVCPRSGLAARHGIGVVNAPGVIDSGYRGELRVVLHNTDAAQPFHIAPGDRIAQLVIVPVALGPVIEVSSLGTTTRDADGFGSTGGFTTPPSIEDGSDR